MRINALLLMLTLMLAPAASDARCRTVGESASLATEYGTFPLYPAFRLVEIGHERDNIPLQVIGYGLSAPLFVVAAPFAMLGAGVGAALHPWTKCIDTQEAPAIMER
jgi:hypothetical protein